MATSGLLELPQIVSSPGMTWDEDVHLEILNRSSLFHHLFDPQEGFPPTSSTTLRVFTTHLDATGTLESYKETSPDSEEIFTSVVLSILFIFIEFLGLVGNVLVIAVVLTNKEMRNASINLFIANLAFADLCVMLTGILETTIFIGDLGWPFPNWVCKAERFFLITCLYSSILTTLTATVERFIAVVLPLRAHPACNKNMALVMINLIWIISMVSGIPVLVFNQVTNAHHNSIDARCRIHVSGKFGLLSYKLLEAMLFYLLPNILQAVFYALIARKLSMGTKEVHRVVRSPSQTGDLPKNLLSRDSHADNSSPYLSSKMSGNKFKSRTEVLKMLAASVLVYFLSFLPQQVLPFYSLATGSELKVNWFFMLLTIFLFYLNSAINPILYAVFSQTFRMQFIKLLTCKTDEGPPVEVADRRNQRSPSLIDAKALKHDSTISESINLMVISSSHDDRRFQ